MSDVMLEAFLSLPRLDTHSLITDKPGQSLCFIIDQSRQQNTLARLYDLGQPIDQDNLYRNTEFAAMADQGPIWVSAPETAELRLLAAQLCLEKNAGIALLTNNVAAAQAHARWLLKASDSSGGQSLLSYYRPALWAALAMTSSQNLVRLMGPWASVFSPAPMHFGHPEGQWIGWRTESQHSSSPAEPCFKLPADTARVQRQLGWVYWVDEHYSVFASPSQDQLPGIAHNLSTLVDHRIAQGRHLLRLSKIVAGPLLDQDPQAMVILESKDSSFKKVERLELFGVEPVSKKRT
ncbi:DUF4123 domain-containing protein [uncultured Halopseudomonas sp.]|uniref:DUF4123 domain-containing protein n=1 Tax=uncultured Halopseudomonas sp. TaxID=2901193 RepID=UPI0030EF33D7